MLKDIDVPTEPFSKTSKSKGKQVNSFEETKQFIFKKNFIPRTKKSTVMGDSRHMFKSPVPTKQHKSTEENDKLFAESICQ